MAHNRLDSPLFDADDFVDPAGLDVDASPERAGGEALALALEDLLPASDGSVIFDADMPVELECAGDRHVIDRGIADAQAEANGESVAGYHYVVFGDGLTLFYPPETSLVLVEG